MNWPMELQEAVESEVARFQPSELKRAAIQLSDAYRQKAALPVSPMSSDLLRSAYLAMRMPGTYGAISSALSQVEQPLRTLGIESVLDVGAGPGTASWAATTQIEGIQQVTLVEKDPPLLRMGQSLAAKSPHPPLRDATWIQGDIAAGAPFPPHDLVIASYVFSELPAPLRAAALEKAWAATQKVLLLLEPGTPEGFSQLRESRQTLLRWGGSLLAPCPHALDCPMRGGDWCHFSARINRTKLHRYLKSGEQGFEDEKFSYLVVSRTPVPTTPRDRILRHPLYAPGSVTLILCSKTGQTQECTVRKPKDVYKRARKVDWGDLW